MFKQIINQAREKAGYMAGRIARYCRSLPGRVKDRLLQGAAEIAQFCRSLLERAQDEVRRFLGKKPWQRPIYLASLTLGLLLLISSLWGPGALRTAIRVDIAGSPAIYVRDEETARQALDLVCQYYAGGDQDKLVSATIREDVDLLPTRVERGRVVKAEAGANLLLYGLMDGGETPSPLLTVQVVRYVDELRDLPYDVVEVDAPELARGERLISRGGHDGEEKLVYRVIEENGALVSRKLAGRAIVRPAREEILQVGTTVYLSSRTGQSLELFDCPLPPDTYYLSSYFGARGSGWHRGIDLPADHGTDIMAAEAGVVTSAGWTGSGYGILVVVEHEDGFETRYAHCSEVYVEKGDQVERGQVIAAVGGTGNATCNHCHFEIVIDGTAVDPLAYLKF